MNNQRKQPNKPCWTMDLRIVDSIYFALKSKLIRNGFGCLNNYSIR